jgi:hypothetical protein
MDDSTTTVGVKLSYFEGIVEFAGTIYGTDI